MSVYCCQYLVLGTGQGGSVLASILSKEFVTIALESGQNADNDPTIVAPLATVPYTEACNAPKYFWQGITCADPDANNRQFNWTNGRLRGGGSSINGMIYSRGSPLRFSQWAATVGPEWSADKVYKAYRKMENFYDPTGLYTGHGTDGKMAIRVGVSDSTATPDFTDAIISTGLPGAQRILDYNDASTPIGVFNDFQYSQFPSGNRASASQTFLDKTVVNSKGEGVKCHKLLLLSETTAIKFIWSDKEKRVTEVTALQDGKLITIKVECEVIVSMGFRSSEFLQVNGIGPRDVLKNAGVEPKVILENVGRGMKNNYFITNLMIPPPGTRNNTNPATFYSGGAFLPDPRPGKNPYQRDIELSSILIPVGGGNFVFIPVLEGPLLPKSDGEITIQNADPLKIAKVDIGFLHNSEDLDTTAAYYQLVMRPIFVSLIAKGYILVNPSLATIDDPVAIREYIKNTISNGHHYQRFNRMGPEELGGVVDVWGSVYHTKNVRIVDASIIPLNMDGNPGLPTEMVAFRIGNHIVKEHKKKYNKC